jgi:hypothetical protein
MYLPLEDCSHTLGGGRLLSFSICRNKIKHIFFKKKEKNYNKVVKAAEPESGNRLLKEGSGFDF